jgi:hypothetical protein
VSIQPAKPAEGIDRPRAFVGIAAIVKVAVVGGCDGPSRQSTGQAWPGESQTPLTPTRWTHRAGSKAAAVSPRKSAARPFNLPHNAKETEFHKSVAELLDWILLPPAMFTTFPAGWGKLSKATAGRLRASGMKKGMPDILVFDARQRPDVTKVVGIELKVGVNSTSSAQRGMFAKLQAVGIQTYICRSVEDVIQVLEHADIPHRRAKTVEKVAQDPRQLDMLNG